MTARRAVWAPAYAGDSGKLAGDWQWLCAAPLLSDMHCLSLDLRPKLCAKRLLCHKINTTAQ